jgi:HSP20 family protein
MPGRKDIERLQEELEELFDDLWRVPRFAGLRRGFRPQVDCFRTDNPPELRIVVELAGIDPSGIALRLADDALLIAGVRRRPTQGERMSFELMEIDYGPFQRRIPLREPVDAAKARATYERGLLTVVLPIAAEAKAAPAKVSIPVRGAP